MLRSINGTMVIQTAMPLSILTTLDIEFAGSCRNPEQVGGVVDLPVLPGIYRYVSKYQFAHTGVD